MCCCYMQYELYRGYATGVWACGTIAAERELCDSDRVFFVAPRLIAYRPALGRIVDAPGRLGVCFESALSQLWHLLGLAKEDKSCASRGVDAALSINKEAAPSIELPCASHGAPPRRGGPPRGPSARRLRSMHEIPGRDLGRTWAVRVQRHLGCGARLRRVSST